MTTTSPPLRQHIISGSENQLIIHLPHHRSWHTIFLAGSLLGSWIFGTWLAGVYHFFRLLEHDLYLILGGGTWLAIGLFCLVYLLQNLAVNEVVEVTPFAIKLRRQVGSWGWTSGYMAANISALQVRPQPHAAAGQTRSLFPSRQDGRTIIFQYGSQTVHFGRGLREKEARDIVALIQAKFPRYRQ